MFLRIYICSIRARIDARIGYAVSPAVRAVSATAHFGMPTPAVAVAIGQIRGLEAVGRNRAFSGEGKLAGAPAGRRPTNCLFLVALGLVNLRSATRPESSRVGVSRVSSAFTCGRYAATMLEI